MQITRKQQQCKEEKKIIKREGKHMGIETKNNSNRVLMQDLI